MENVQRNGSVMEEGGRQVRILVELTAALGAVLTAVGLYQAVNDPFSSLWILMFVGILVAIVPANFYALFTQRMPRFVPWWVDLILLGFFLVGILFSGVGTAADSPGRLFQTASAIAFCGPCYVAANLIKAMVTHNPEYRFGKEIIEPGFKSCGKCGRVLKPTDKFCPNCGMNLSS